MVDLRCPRGCPKYLVRDFEGDYLEVKCPTCGWTVRLSHTTPEENLSLQIGKLLAKLDKSASV